MAPQLLDVLKRWKAETNPRPTDFIVPGGVVGRPMSRQAFDKQLRATCEQLGLVGVSSLRHPHRRAVDVQDALPISGDPIRHPS